MNLDRPNWQHGFSSLAILILLLAGLYLLLVQPAFSAKYNNVERIENLQFQSGKLQRSRQKVEFITSEIEQLQKQYPDKNDFLKNNTLGIVAANLQKRIETVIESNGGNLISTNPLTKENDDLYPKITIKVHMRSDIKTLQKVFYQITINKPLLFTENVIIQKRHAAPRKNQQNNNQIEVRFDVSGYMKPSPA